MSRVDEVLTEMFLGKNWNWDPADIPGAVEDIKASLGEVPPDELTEITRAATAARRLERRRQATRDAVRRHRKRLKKESQA